MMYKRNSAKCNYCGKEIESTHVHHMASHECMQAGLIGRQYSHETGEYTPAYPFFAVDGGPYYLRRLGEAKHFTDTSIEA